MTHPPSVHEDGCGSFSRLCIISSSCITKPM